MPGILRPTQDHTALQVVSSSNSQANASKFSCSNPGVQPLICLRSVSGRTLSAAARHPAACPRQTSRRAAPPRHRAVSRPSSFLALWLKSSQQRLSRSPIPARTRRAQQQAPAREHRKTARSGASRFLRSPVRPGALREHPIERSRSRALRRFERPRRSLLRTQVRAGAIRSSLLALRVVALIAILQRQARYGVLCVGSQRAGAFAGDPARFDAAATGA